jgi:micrococcal nuclease
MKDFLYHYRMKVTKVVDGDTIYGDVDLGFSVVQKKMEFRFAGINTPETRGGTREAGLRSKEFVTNKLMDKEVIIITKKDGKEKFGRYLAQIYYQDGLEWVCINDELVKLGLAVPFMV